MALREAGGEVTSRTRVCLLLLDLMVRTVERFGDADLRQNWGAARDAAVAAGIPVVFVRVAFRKGYPEVPRGNALFSQLAANGALLEDDPETMIHSEIVGGGDAIIVTKRRVSAFSGSDLDVVLRGLGAGTLVLTGLSTSGVVLATLIDALDRDFGVVVLSDACADGDTVLHHALVDRFFPTRAAVLTTSQWVASIGAVENLAGSDQAGLV
jgi:nicotinamidase-related amidase